VGACADIAGIHALGYRFTSEELSETVYGDSERFKSLGHPQPIDAVVAVEYRLPGCPPQPQEFLDLIQSLRLARDPEVILHPVCVDCKLKEYPCLFDDDIICLGPVTKGGCDAICVGNGDRCRGCRGEVSNPRSNPYQKILIDAGLTAREIASEYRAFNLASIKKGRGRDED
jgi:coenzyme F420-reducing hydrogenase gamma subunit